MDKISFVLDDGKASASFYVLDRAVLGGRDYLLVTDTAPEEEEAEAGVSAGGPGAASAADEEEGIVLVLKDTADAASDEAAYEIVEDDDELSAVCALFKDTIEELGIDTGL